MIDKKEREIAKIIMKNNSFPLRMHESPLRVLRAKVDDTRSLKKQMDGGVLKCEIFCLRNIKISHVDSKQSYGRRI
ncbi:hypothetical protein ACJIZ3_019979 [Penstemon smallii]|uniref:Uncharacterized protein n=1 Tax=Penstemon smallii TaxID=265156 RepID=A0ABD3T2V4_9LAMI